MSFPKIAIRSPPSMRVSKPLLAYRLPFSPHHSGYHPQWRYSRRPARYRSLYQVVSRRGLWTHRSHLSVVRMQRRNKCYNQLRQQWTSIINLQDFFNGITQNPQKCAISTLYYIYIGRCLSQLLASHHRVFCRVHMSIRFFRRLSWPPASYQYGVPIFIAQDTGFCASD